MKKFIGLALGLTAVTGLTVYLTVRNPIPYNKPKEKTLESHFFAQVPLNRVGSLALTTGDFDGDGDLDIIVGAHYSGYGSERARVYLFKNDGKGNFSQYP